MLIKTQSHSIPNVVHLLQVSSFSSSNPVLRKYEVWTALAEQKGFTVKEVLEATALGPYIVIDPDDPGMLLALNAISYAKMKDSCISNQKALILLLSPLDEKLPSRQSSEDTQTSPTPPRLEGHGKRPGAPRVSRPMDFRPRWFSGLYDRSWTFISGRLALGKGGETLLSELLQRWFTRLCFWSGRPHLRKNGSVVEFVDFVLRLYRCNGLVFTTQYLKVALFIVQRYVVGDRVVRNRDYFPWISLQAGLPAFLPLS